LLAKAMQQCLTIIIGLAMMFAMMVGSGHPTETADAATRRSAAIQYLLTFVKNSDCRFIRNDKEYSAAEAAAHIERKYEYFKNEIKTAKDFVRLTATKSLLSGKMYYVILKNGQKMTAAAWLLEALNDYQLRQK